MSEPQKAMTAEIQYYHFVSATGANRYFKVDWLNDKCTQVVINAGEKKKGRPHCFGVSHLAMMSFRGNYYWYFGRKYDVNKSRCMVTTETQFKKAFIKVIQEL